MDNGYVVSVRAAGLREFPHESLASLVPSFTLCRAALALFCSDTHDRKAGGAQGGKGTLHCRTA
jgi:hypothetical protein